MRNAKIFTLVFLWLTFCYPYPTTAQIGDESGTDGVKVTNNIWPVLLKRYARPTSLYVVGEDLTTLGIDVDGSRNFDGIGIRICSHLDLYYALPLATMNPFQLADHLVNVWGFSRSQITLMRDEGCVSDPGDRESYPTEIWGIKTQGHLPSYVQHVDYQMLKLRSIGFDPVDCPKVVYRRYLAELVHDMKSDPHRIATIIGYYLSTPSRKLRSNINRIKSELLKQGVSSSRFMLAYQRWHDGDSPCSDKEPTDPVVWIIDRGSD